MTEKGKRVRFLHALELMRRGACMRNNDQFYRIDKDTWNCCVIQVWRRTRWEPTARLPVNGWREMTRNDVMALLYSQLP